VTKVYERWFESLNSQEIEHVTAKVHPIIKVLMPNLFLSVTPENAIAVNNIAKGALIIACNAMWTGGVYDITLYNEFVIRVTVSFFVSLAFQVD
jgi:metallo-beta-lactamase family protein